MSVIQQGLLITAIGMGLVFAVIIFLWGLMALLVRMTSNNKIKPEPEAELQSETERVQSLVVSEGQRRAAAAATAVALTIESCQHGRSKNQYNEQFAGLSPWQAFHRTHQFEDQ